MDIGKYLLRLMYNAYLMVRERFFLVPPPGTHPLLPFDSVKEGTGGDEFRKLSDDAFGDEADEVLAGKGTDEFEASPVLGDQHVSLCETLDRVLNTGVVVHGDITISVANIDLIYIGLRALLTSVETARQSGVDWR